jgi:hypothetical protein
MLRECSKVAAVGTPTFLAWSGGSNVVIKHLMRITALKKSCPIGTVTIEEWQSFSNPLSSKIISDQPDWFSLPTLSFLLVLLLADPSLNPECKEVCDPV